MKPVQHGTKPIVDGYRYEPKLTGLMDPIALDISRGRLSVSSVRYATMPLCCAVPPTFLKLSALT